MSRLFALLFSRDRAMQVDAVLRSFLLHCRDAPEVDLFVLYTATNQQHSRQYAGLIAKYQVYPSVHFVFEQNFRRDVLGLLATQSGLDGVRFRLYRESLRLGHHFGFFNQPLLRFPTQSYVLLLVDDNLFVADFYARQAMETLSGQPQAIGFSLRLGRNTTYCYALDRPQALPEFIPLAGGPVKFDWRLGEHDFHYPLEVSSSIYRTDLILKRLNRAWFRNPNTMESRLAEAWQTYQQDTPWLLCYTQSVTFCNPVNQVEYQYQNRSGVVHAYSNQYLADQFDAGLRIDVSAYSGFVPAGCHQERELLWVGGESA
jgi:hypothetical protein